ncbi:MAG: hypothetical protein AABX11_01590 [Nanoarchaeota archaeon]
MIEEIKLLQEEFELMEKEKEVNLMNSLPLIQNIALKLKNIRNDLLNSDKPKEEIFRIYYPSMVASIVLQNMKDRLSEAKIMHDNPIIALNSLNVIPSLKVISDYLEKGETRTDFVRLTTNLQNSAISNDLFKINQERLKEGDNVLRSIVSDIKSIE